MDNKKVIKAHVSIFTACMIWGLMSPIGKDAMINGISGIVMVAFRVIGGAILFWMTSLFTKREEVSSHDMMLLFFAALLGLVFNQCCFTIGLSLTSPINASIITTTLPIITMILSAIFLHEPVTSKKVMGIFCGAIGALMLIIGSISATSSKVGDIRGDLLCLLAQLSFACYLAFFKHLIQRYNIITIEKWMFIYASIIIIPLSYHQVASLPLATITVKTWIETAFVVVGGTFLAYILMMIGQKILRPTVVSMYNYVQPIVACIVSVITGLGIFGMGQATAVILVFMGVYLVTKSKSRADLLKEKNKRAINSPEL
jgi:drug/metabolite transporter (DMT)-like permease